MSLYLKGLGIHIYLTTIKNLYFSNSKYIEANSKVIHALMSTLNDKHLSRTSNINSAFVVWNTLVSLDEQEKYYARSDSDDGSNASNVCYMVQGDNPLEVNSESELEEDVDMPYDELESFISNFLKSMTCLKGIIRN